VGKRRPDDSKSHLWAHAEWCRDFDGLVAYENLRTVVGRRRPVAQRRARGQDQGGCLAHHQVVDLGPGVDVNVAVEAPPRWAGQLAARQQPTRDSSAAPERGVRQGRRHYGGTGHRSSVEHHDSVATDSTVPCG
jgi:hypothetical protein